MSSSSTWIWRHRNSGGLNDQVIHFGSNSSGNVGVQYLQRMTCHVNDYLFLALALSRFPSVDFGRRSHSPISPFSLFIESPFQLIQSPRRVRDSEGPRRWHAVTGFSTDARLDALFIHRRNCTAIELSSILMLLQQRKIYPIRKRGAPWLDGGGGVRVWWEKLLAGCKVWTWRLEDRDQDIDGMFFCGGTAIISGQGGPRLVMSVRTAISRHTAVWSP